jgi:Spx/MgsR family transcriptional regulator
MFRTMAITLYGIPNCDTVKRARAWLAEHGIAYDFHDFKKAGVPAAAFDDWLECVGWETLLNRRGTAWRALPDDLKAGVTDAASARAVMLAHASTIKRPVVDWGGGRITVGFDAGAWSALQLSTAQPAA